MYRSLISLIFLCAAVSPVQAQDSDTKGPDPLIATFLSSTAKQQDLSEIQATSLPQQIAAPESVRVETVSKPERLGRRWKGIIASLNKPSSPAAQSEASETYRVADRFAEAAKHKPEDERADYERRLREVGVCNSSDTLAQTSKEGDTGAAPDPESVAPPVSLPISSPQNQPERRAMPARQSGWVTFINSMARQHGMPPRLVHAIVHQESRYNPRAISPKGAAGLMQLMPQTARELGVRNVFDPGENVDGGLRYLRRMWAEFGDLRLALAAYNAGPAAVKRHGGIPPYAETRNYVATIMNNYLGSNRTMRASVISSFSQLQN
jgi:hypothetical protein